MIMESSTQTYFVENSFNRSIAMVLALISSLVLSPLYVNRKSETRSYETRWSSGFVLPMVLVGLIVAIKTVSTSSSSSASIQEGGVNRGSPVLSSLDSSFVLRIGRSSWGLAGILVLLCLVLSWQGSVQEFLWR